jgi:SAM-dependent methyltransferase
MDNHGHTPSATEPLTHANIDSFPDDTLMTEALASSKGDSILTVDHSSSEQDNSDAYSVASNFSSTHSATSSVYDFVEEHGRTYHKYKEGQYVLPNDVEEQNRLDLQHQLALKLLKGRLQLAPVPATVQKVLDVATGTGIWAIEFAQRYPQASVTGTDLSPIQPEYVPANCQIEIDDAEDEWVFSAKFDFIHIRAVMTCFANPRFVIEQAYRTCAPGGYLEMQDGIFPLHCHDDFLEGTL